MRSPPRPITTPPHTARSSLLTLGTLAAVTVLALATLAVATLAPAATSADARLRLDIPPALPAQTTTATLTLADAQPVRGFNLLLSFAPAQLLSAAAADFARNAAYLPPSRLGEHDLNTIRDAGPGRIRIIALAPVSTTGQVEIGRLMMRVAVGAPLGATQAVTISGEVNLAGQGVVAVEPVVAVFRVGEPLTATATPTGGIPTAGSTATVTAVNTPGSPTATPSPTRALQTNTPTLPTPSPTLTPPISHTATRVPDPTNATPTATPVRETPHSTPTQGTTTPTPGNRIYLSWAARNASRR